MALAFLSSFWGSGVIQRSYPVILKPLSNDLQIPRTMGVLGVTLSTLVGDLASPLSGSLVDRRGVRLLMTVCAGITGLSFIALSQVKDLWSFLLIFGLVLGLVRPTLQRTGAQTMVAKWFVQRRGQAVTYATLGLPLSAIVLIPFTQWMVETTGWRAAWFVLGLGTLLMLMIPSAIFMRGAPEEMGLLPDGAPSPNDAATTTGGQASRAGTAPELSWSREEALHSRPFWMLAFGFAIIGMVPSILSLHMFPYFTDQGIPAAQAAAANGSFGAWVIGSRLIFWGKFLDRTPIQRTLVFWGALMTLAIGTMLIVHDVFLAYVAAAVFGLAMGGTAPLGIIAWARYFGRAQLGSITGVAALTGIGSSIFGPLMPSLIFDATGSYHGAFVVATIICVAGIVMFALAGAPRAPRNPVT